MKLNKLEKNKLLNNNPIGEYIKNNTGILIGLLVFCLAVFPDGEKF